MPTLHLMYGFTGAGKTTFARQLEREIRAVRFSPDGEHPTRLRLFHYELLPGDIIWVRYHVESVG